MSDELPEGWEWKKLDEVCSLITDGSHFSPKEIENGEYRIATVADMGDKKININSCKKISKTDYDFIVKNGCKPCFGDVLLSKDGTIGKTFPYTQSDDIVLLSSIAIIRSKNDLNPNFCSYFLKTPLAINQYSNKTKGTGLKRIILKDIRKIKIPLPPLEIQKKLVAILEKAEQLQRLQAEIDMHFDELIKSIFIDMFGDPVTNPKGWERTKLIDAVGGKNELIVGGPFGSNLKVIDYKDKGIPLIRLQNIEVDNFLMKGIKFISFEKANELSYHSFNSGDILNL